MSSPLQFYRSFKDLLAGSGIRHVLTSGMACVEYGIQQTTKDTDWIVHPDDLADLVDTLAARERGLSGANWRVSYRSLFGAPLLRDYLAHGWTSHLAIRDEPLSPEHHVDIFGQPPRLAIEQALAGAQESVAARLVVAQMKKTDRDKDWPMVEALSIQALSQAQEEAVLHLREPERLTAAWSAIPEEHRSLLTQRRPLLARIGEAAPQALPRLLAIERSLWEQVNKLRHRRFEFEWKAFLRRWRAENDFGWPVSAPFMEQHRLVIQAVATHALPVDPLGGAEGRAGILEQARGMVAATFAADSAFLDGICPPLSELLP